MTSQRVGKAIAAKQLQLRDTLWPGCAPLLWDRTANKGFATIPKTLPYVLQIMDDLSKGKRVSETFLGLWCETWDNSFVNISNPQSMALAAGFSGQRAVYTWMDRINQLERLSFIGVKPGQAGPVSHVLIYNPHLVIKDHRAKGTLGLTEAKYTMLLARAQDVGAMDMFS